MRLDSSHNCISTEKKIIEKWAKIKKGLKVIPYITDVDYDGYTMEELMCPCEEGELIVKVLHNCLFSPERSDWKESQIEKVKALVGEDNAEWVMNWLDDYCDDYKLITKSNRMAGDIRSVNIGKDKGGNVKIFDWFDPYCF